MSLFQCPNLHVSKGAIWRVYRVPHCSRVTSTRTFYVPVATGEDGKPTASREEKADRLSGTWYIPDPANVDYKAVLARFPQLLPTRRRRLTSALFLVTPKLAKLFETSHPFHQGAINRIYQSISSDSPPESIIAVVDALPSPKIPDGTLPLPGHEGIAICLSPDRFSNTEFMELQSEQSLIRFHTAPSILDDEAGSMFSVTLPAANTLFVNGLGSTVFKQTWTQGQEGEQSLWLPKDAPVHLSSLDVVMPFTASRFKGTHIPMQPITPARKIVSSMGNVLRELEGDDGATLRGSTELESNVPQFIKKKEAEGLSGVVKVFALVMPPSSYSAPPPSADDDAKVQNQSAGNETESSFSSSSLLSTSMKNIHGKLVVKALKSGGRIIRVTGGGGGWGKKQGLLSLDDKVNFNTDESLESGMFPSFDEEIVDQPLVTPQELLQPGHTIQFFAAWVGSTEPREEVQRFISKSPTANYTARTWSKVKEQKWILGTNLASEDAEPQMGGAEEIQFDERTTGIHPVAGYFGMLSNRGVCIAHEVVQNEEEMYTTPSPKYKTHHQFRIDVPHSVLRCSWVGPSAPKEVPSANEQESEVGSSDDKAQIVRSRVRSSEGRVAKAGKSRETKPVRELDPGHYYRGGDVVGYENLNKTFKLIIPKKQTLRKQPKADSPVDQFGDDATRSQSQGDSNASNRSDSVEGRGGYVAETHSESSATSRSADAIAEENLDPIFRKYDAPNKVSWDRPRGNVKAGESRS